MAPIRSKLSEIGKMIRKFRIEEDMYMVEMAKSLNVPLATLSAFETGRRTITEDVIKKLISIYNFNPKETYDAYFKSLKEINLKPKDDSSLDLSIMFARKLNSLTDEEIERLKVFLGEGSDDKTE